MLLNYYQLWIRLLFRSNRQRCCVCLLPWRQSTGPVHRLSLLRTLSSNHCPQHQHCDSLPVQPTLLTPQRSTNAINYKNKRHKCNIVSIPVEDENLFTLHPVRMVPRP